MLTAFDGVISEKDTRAIVLTGADKGFCSGAELGGDRGLPIHFSEIRIERADSSRAAPGELGEILGRSPAMVTH